MANAPLSDETGWILPVIWGNDQSRDLRRINTTGKSVEVDKFVSTEQQLLGFGHLGRRAFHVADIAEFALQA
jgi:hypothetical protein